MIKYTDFLQFGPEQLVKRYGMEEYQSSVGLMREIGPETYERKYGRPELTATDTGATVPYDAAAGVFSLKNLSALAQNLPGNATDVATGLAASITNPIDTLQALASVEGLNAIVDDIKSFVTSPGEYAVERPFEFLMNIAPGAQALKLAKGSKAASMASKGILQKVDAVSPKTRKYLANLGKTLDNVIDDGGNPSKTRRAAKAAANLAIDPLGTIVKGVHKIGAKALKGAEIGLFQIPSIIGTGMERSQLTRILDYGKLSDIQQIAAAPALSKTGIKQRVLGTGFDAPTTDDALNTLKNPVQAFREVLTGVKDEHAIMDHIVTGLNQIDDEIENYYAARLPDVIDTAEGPISILDDINIFVKDLRKEGVDITLDKTEHTFIKSSLVDAFGNALPDQRVTQIIPQLKMDVSKSAIKGVGSDIKRLEQFVDFVNDNYWKNPNKDVSPRELFTVHNYTRKLLDRTPVEGANVVDHILNNVDQAFRKRLGELKTVDGNTAEFNKLMSEISARQEYVSAINKEMQLYKTGAVNAGVVLRKIVAGGRESKSYQRNLLKQMEARVGPLNAAIDALEMRGHTPKGLVGRQLGISAIAGFGAVSAGLPWASLIAIPFVSPKIVGRMASRIGLSRRASDYIAEVSKELHRYPTAIEMGKFGYTMGGILLKHGEFLERANKNQAFGEDE